MRLGTLLGTDDLIPECAVQIVRRNQTSISIRRLSKVKGSDVVSTTIERVPESRVLDDGGIRWEQHSHNPRAASWVDAQGKVKGRLHVSRAYKKVVKAKLYLGDNKWSEVEDFTASEVRFDGGVSAGWSQPVYEQRATHSTELSVPQTPPRQVTGSTTKEEVNSTGQKIAYLRVSTKDQSLDRQREALSGIGVTKEFQDHVSARKGSQRPGLQDCLSYLRAGDELHVTSIDRLARSLIDLKKIVSELTGKGVSIHFRKEGLTFTANSNDPTAELMLAILGAFAEFERSVIHERQAEGIALAKAQGRYKGRPPALSPSQVQEARTRIANGDSKSTVAKDLGVARSTLHRALKNSDCATKETPASLRSLGYRENHSAGAP